MRNISHEHKRFEGELLMNTKTDIRAGMTFEECDAQRNYWKNMSKSGTCYGYPYYPKPPTPYTPGIRAQ
jgi:hypothetical protein